MSFLLIFLTSFCLLNLYQVQGNPIKDPQDEKFDRCCEPILNESIRNIACRYPSHVASWNMTLQIEIAIVVNQYVECYTDGKDNRECCEKSGVNGEYKDCQV
uniref:Uncharacterized protein n=1 Tax=Acrobeloides nanus TaxID=290746 RepID=A0A914DHS8_9BILA